MKQKKINLYPSRDPRCHLRLLRPRRRSPRRRVPPHASQPQRRRLRRRWLLLRFPQLRLRREAPRRPERASPAAHLLSHRLPSLLLSLHSAAAAGAPAAEDAGQAGPATSRLPLLCLPPPPLLLPPPPPPLPLRQDFAEARHLRRPRLRLRHRRLPPSAFRGKDPDLGWTPGAGHGVTGGLDLGVEADDGRLPGRSGETLRLLAFGAAGLGVGEPLGGFVAVVGGGVVDAEYERGLEGRRPREVIGLLAGLAGVLFHLIGQGFAGDLAVAAEEEVLQVRSRHWSAQREPRECAGVLKHMMKRDKH
ncbi:hypothetical protein Cni_G24444 [Canna indica]|uniref:Uncharacterized protein n=1 Tax=Canna indica TaxID=4628 RepID=A0AAQ3KVB9_9LILI|nr:hypothetical protein Cni_G24444 [Canna indica]